MRARERFWKLHGAPDRLTIDVDASARERNRRDSAGDPFHIDPAALGTRAELEPRTPITDEELARYESELVRLRACWTPTSKMPPDGIVENSLQARRAEIDELRNLIAQERAGPADETPEQRRTRELRELGDVALTLSAEAGVDAPGYDTRERRALLSERLAALDIDAEALRATRPPRRRQRAAARNGDHNRVPPDAARTRRHAGPPQSPASPPPARRTYRSGRMSPPKPRER